MGEFSARLPGRSRTAFHLGIQRRWKHRIKVLFIRSNSKDLTDERSSQNLHQIIGVGLGAEKLRTMKGDIHGSVGRDTKAPTVQLPPRKNIHRVVTSHIRGVYQLEPVRHVEKEII